MNEEIGHSRDPTGLRLNIVFVVFGVIGAYFLITEHRAHVLPYLPWLFLAACLFMHRSMHGGHGHGGHRSNGSEAMRTDSAQPAMAPIEASVTAKSTNRRRDR